MGVKGFSAFAKKHQLYSETLNLQEFKTMFKGSKVYVDLYGSFYNLIRYYALDNQYAALAKCLANVFSGVDVVFVLDGARSMEKHDTHVARDSQRETKLKLFSEALAGIKIQGKVSRSKWRRLDKLKFSCFRITETCTKSISEALVSAILKIVNAEFESDVEISRLVTQLNSDDQSRAVVVSNDSDSLFYGYKIVARPFLQNKYDTNSMHFTIFREDTILRKLCVTRECWRALAVIAGNDYVTNVRNFGIAKCLEEIQRIDENHTYKAEELVSEFEHAPAKEGHFQNAVAVFLTLKETKCEVCIESSSDGLFNDCRETLNSKREQYKALRAVKHQITQGRTVVQLKHLKLPLAKNRFSPLIHCEYGRFKVKSISKEQLMEPITLKDVTSSSLVPLKSSTKKISKKKQRKKKKRRQNTLSQTREPGQRHL